MKAIEIIICLLLLAGAVWSVLHPDLPEDRRAWPPEWQQLEEQAQ